MDWWVIGLIVVGVIALALMIAILAAYGNGMSR